VTFTVTLNQCAWIYYGKDSFYLEECRTVDKASWYI